MTDPPASKAEIEESGNGERVCTVGVDISRPLSKALSTRGVKEVLLFPLLSTAKGEYLSRTCCNHCISAVLLP